jgi:uncharacterized protein YjbI with pentapeptide repeats
METKQMNNYPDFSQHGYEAIAELGRNQEAGRITYKANALSLDKFVVIKEFRFALAGANWSGYKAYEREIEVLQQLSHPRIPHYVDSFETPQGFCLVQEYKNAPTLGERHSFEPEQIKEIAVSVLEILVYLQKRTPPIIHRDIKPENILVDEELNAYLVDFGFARIRGGEVALSSVAAGTPGFMPPEEMFNRPLTEASDLYSLGVTLIGLLTGTRSVDIGKLIDDNYRLDFKSKVPQLNPDFIDWLEKMVASNVKERYPNAAVALETLKPIDVVGNAIGIKAPTRSIKLNEPIAAVGLITIGAIALGGITNITPKQSSDVTNITPKQSSDVTNITPKQSSNVTRLLTTKACVKCNLQNANLEGAKLEGANLESANLKGANLENALLSAANLTGANLKSANLRGASLWGTYLRSANLNSANLERVQLRNARLINTNLEGANLGDANLADAFLQGANLRRANLEGAYLGNVNFKSAKLGGAKLKGAMIIASDLRGVYLEGANLEDTNLDGTIMPDGTRHK